MGLIPSIIRSLLSFLTANHVITVTMAISPTTPITAPKMSGSLLCCCCLSSSGRGGILVVDVIRLPGLDVTVTLIGALLIVVALVTVVVVILVVEVGFLVVTSFLVVIIFLVVSGGGLVVAGRPWNKCNIVILITVITLI